jgi:hypothetical protein
MGELVVGELVVEVSEVQAVLAAVVGMAVT